MIRTAKEYEYAVKNIERIKLEKYCATIPHHINRAGKYYQKLIRDFKNKNL